MKANYDVYMCRTTNLLSKFIGMHKDIMMKTEFHLAVESLVADDETVRAMHDNVGILQKFWIVKK